MTDISDTDISDAVLMLLCLRRVIFMLVHLSVSLIVDREREKYNCRF